MMGFDLLKTLGLKKLANRALDGLKRDLTREIDRAIGKLEDGQAVSLVVDQLHAVVADLLAKVKLPLPLGGILASLLMMLDWRGLMDKPAEDAVRELERLKKQVAGVRL